MNQSYGQLPIDLGIINIKCDEMMFCQYLPIKMAHSGLIKFEDRLAVFDDLIHVACTDLSAHKYSESYIYLTAKHLFVQGNQSGNRPGWHSDGFLTDDTNYIWTDAEPTVFNNSSFNLTPDHDLSLLEMEKQAFPCNNFRYPVNSLLKLNQYVIHRSPDNCKPGFRTFVKISVSKEKYNLKGNSHNYLFNYNWNMVEREEQRNHPTK